MPSSGGRAIVVSAIIAGTGFVTLSISAPIFIAGLASGEPARAIATLLISLPFVFIYASVASLALAAIALGTRLVLDDGWLERATFWYPAVTGIGGGLLLLVGAFLSTPYRQLEVSAALFGILAGGVCGALQRIVLLRMVHKGSTSNEAVEREDRNQ